MLIPVVAVTVFFNAFIIVMAIDAFRWCEMGRLWRLIKLGSLLMFLSCVSIWAALTYPDWHPAIQFASGFGSDRSNSIAVQHSFWSATMPTGLAVCGALLVAIVLAGFFRG